MTLDERIRENLGAAARSVEARTPGSLEAVRRSSGRRTVVRRTGWALVGATAVSVFVFLAARVEPAPVASFDGIDIVTGEMSSIPVFDTSDLGSDVTLDPVSDVSAVIAEARLWEARGAEVLRIDMVGTSPSGADVYVLHLLDPTDDMIMRCIDGACSSGEVGDYANQPDGLIPLTPGTEPTTMTGGEGGSELIWELPQQVSVAKLAVGNESYWQRPIGGVAYFEIDGGLDQRIVMTTFDDGGQILDQYRHPTRGSGFVCPITLPTNPDFLPPDGYQQQARVGDGFFGSADLWTTLPVDGAYQLRKSVWWSRNFPGGAVEEQPPISVTWDRLDVTVDPVNVSPGTNARTATEGDFMIAGIDPGEPGCWEVTASYKGATVRYVYENG